MDLFELLGTIKVDNSGANKALDETSGKGEKSESKLKSAFSKIGGAALAVGKTVATGMAAGATAIGALVKQSIEAYADYEQLVGGVETLFEDSAQKVQDYAKIAYQTAGLSANEYMETVTSFSAALLQSLDGNASEAADKADMAIRDMSDNANKMGSDMAAIQTAYNGFAKQNYTMLDNLKLGYGGTKEEMQRLLKDAEAISGIKYDVSSYADVVDAIHVIQTEMGITGTTAKEASSTISGSISSMKSSWQNLLTAFIATDMSMEDEINNFVDSVSTVADNVLPKISIALDSVVLLVETLAPKIIEKIPGIASQLLPSIIAAATTLITSLISQLPSLMNMLTTSVIPQVLSGFVSIVNALVDSLPLVMESIISALPTLLPLLISGLVSMIVNLCSNFSSIIQPLIDYLPDILISLVDSLVTNLPILIDGFVMLITGLVSAMPQITIGLAQAAPEIIRSLVTGLIGAAGSLIEGWKSIWQSVKDSFFTMWNAVKEQFIWFFSELWSEITGAFSVVATWFNDNVIQPVVNFFTGLWESMKEIWDKICNAVKVAVQLIGSILKAAFDIITLPFRFIWENCKEYVFAAWEWIKEKIDKAITKLKDIVQKGFTFIKEKIINPITEVYNKVVEIFTNIKNSVTDKINDLKAKVTDKFNELKAKATEIFNAIKEKITTPINNAKDKVVSTFNTVKDKISTTITNIRDKVASIFDSVKQKMTQPIEKARDTIKGIVDKIKGFFSGMNISFPHIKLPHFSIKPSGWKIGDLLQGSIPSLGISWYAKAMNNPMIMKSPTIFGYDPATGNLMGGGEAGSEIVAGTNTLMNMISTAVSKNSEVQTERIVTVLTTVLEAILGGNDELVKAIRAGHVIKVNEREFARTVREYA